MHRLTTSYTSATQSIDGRLSLSSISPLRPLRWEPSDGDARRCSHGHGLW